MYHALHVGRLQAHLADVMRGQEALEAQARRDRFEREQADARAAEAVERAAAEEARTRQAQQQVCDMG